METNFDKPLEQAIATKLPGSVSTISDVQIFTDSQRTNLILRGNYSDGEYLQTVFFGNSDKSIEIKKGNSQGQETTLATFKETKWIDISSQFTYSSTYVDDLSAKTDGNWVQLYLRVKKGTPDQTTVVTVPNAYKPSVITAFNIFYMHGEDMGRSCNACIEAGAASVQFRCSTTPTGTYGVRLSCVYHI